MRLLMTALLAVAVLAPAASAGPALKTVRVDDFRMGVPSAWRTETRVGTVRLMTAAPRQESGVFTNANVVVTPSASGLPVGYRAELIRMFRSAGVKVTSLSTRQVRLPAGKAVRLRYNGTMAGRRLSFLAYAFQAHGKAYVVTFTAGRGAYARNTPLFTRMARSFRIR
ncbi:MAG: hypothetical protein ACXWYS_07295 [Gaiellaceae bacterium]